MKGQRWRPAIRGALVCVLAALGAIHLPACSDASPGPPPAPTPVPPPDPPIGPTAPAVFVGAGDIAMCGVPGAEATARLLDRIPGTVFTTGDHAYMSGTTREFLDCYHPTWGRHLSRTFPVPGNHDYETPNATAYFQYFGLAAGPPGLGYYSYRVGAWQVIALNSEIDIGPGSAQMAWLRTELAAHRGRCTAAQWHRPLFTSGPNGDNEAVREAWRAFYEFGGEIVLNGHDHLYERFAPQDPGGRPDPARGIRQFTVGTGGASLYQVARRRGNSEAVGTEWGVLKLTLEEDRYAWEFVPVDGGRFADAGTGTCH
jgi:hypothetical protein